MPYPNQPYNYPYSFNPYQTVQNPMMQNQMMQSQPMANPQQIPAPVQQQTPMTQQTSGMIWVSGRAEADSWPIAPGNAVALWDSNAPIVYLRQADSTGKPSTKPFDLVEHTDILPEKEVPPDLSKYITIDAAEEMIDRRVNEVLAERLKRSPKANQKKEDAE